MGVAILVREHTLKALEMRSVSTEVCNWRPSMDLYIHRDYTNHHS